MYDETQTYRGAIKALREAERDIFDEKLAAISIRIDAMEKATSLQHETVTRVPTLLDREATRLESLLSEKINTLDIAGKTTISCIEATLNRTTTSLARDILSARAEAQTANNGLQRLLESSSAAFSNLVNNRFAAQDVAIGKVENGTVVAKDVTMAAATAAREAVDAAVKEVNEKGVMRYETGLKAIEAVERRVGERLIALQQLSELGARMNETAVEKANEANEKRFEAIIDFNSKQSEQSREFVTVPVLASRTGQLETKLDGYEREIRALSDTTQNSINTISNRLTAREAAESSRRDIRTSDHLSIGSVVGIIGGIGVVITILAMLMHYSPSSLNPAVAATSDRLDSLITRLDSMSRRLDEVSHAQK
jgi:hypothetical protein